MTVKTIDEMCNQPPGSLASETGKYENLEAGKCGVPFSQILHAMDQCPEVMRLEGKTPQRIAWYRSWLNRWKASGCTPITEWPEPDRENDSEIRDRLGKFLADSTPEDLRRELTKGIRPQLQGASYEPIRLTSKGYAFTVDPEVRPIE